MFVEEKKIHISKPLELNSGKVLSAYDLMYETYGQLNDDKSNAVLSMSCTFWKPSCCGFT